MYFYGVGPFKSKNRYLIQLLENFKVSLEQLKYVTLVFQT